MENCYVSGAGSREKPHSREALHSKEFNRWWCIIGTHRYRKKVRDSSTAHIHSRRHGHGFTGTLKLTVSARIFSLSLHSNFNYLSVCLFSAVCGGWSHSTVSVRCPRNIFAMRQSAIEIYIDNCIDRSSLALLSNLAQSSGGRNFISQQFSRLPADFSAKIN